MTTASTLGGVIRLSLVHDTTMWNEGFEYAREPLATVVVDEASAEVLSAWVATRHALTNDRHTWDRAFRCTVDPSDPHLPVLGEQEARAQLTAAIAGWGGL